MNADLRGLFVSQGYNFYASNNVDAASILCWICRFVSLFGFILYWIILKSLLAHNIVGHSIALSRVADFFLPLSLC